MAEHFRLIFLVLGLSLIVSASVHADTKMLGGTFNPLSVVQSALPKETERAAWLPTIIQPNTLEKSQSDQQLPGDVRSKPYASADASSNDGTAPLILNFDLTLRPSQKASSIHARQTTRSTIEDNTTGNSNRWNDTVEISSVPVLGNGPIDARPTEHLQPTAHVLPTIPLPSLQIEQLRLHTGYKENALRVGKSLMLDQSLSHDANCISAPRPNEQLCILDIEWPGEIAEAFFISNLMYRGTKAIVRYRNGFAERAYAMYPAFNLRKVAEHLQRVFGEAEYAEIAMPVIGNPEAKNEVFRWTRRQNGGDVMLELREFDDVRDMMPDQRVGVLRLFKPESAQIFENVSSSSLFLSYLSAR